VRPAAAHKHLGPAQSVSRDTEPEGKEPRNTDAAAMGEAAAALGDDEQSCVVTEVEAEREVEMDVQFERSRYY
jgi:hypothetical protein